MSSKIHKESESDFRRFESLAKGLISVPRSELQSKLDAEKKSKAGKKK